MKPWVAVDGPHWMPAPRRGDLQRDGRGVLWVVVRIAAGGRIIYWETEHERPTRVAKTEATPACPGYPSDEAVVEWEREQKRNARQHPYWFY